MFINIKKRVFQFLLLGLKSLRRGILNYGEFRIYLSDIMIEIFFGRRVGFVEYIFEELDEILGRGLFGVPIFREVKQLVSGGDFILSLMKFIHPLLDNNNKKKVMIILNIAKKVTNMS